MRKNKLILFDWGGIVESHLTGYTIYDAFNDLFLELGYQGSDIFQDLRVYDLLVVNNLEEFRDRFNLIKKDMNLKGSFSFFLRRYNYYLNKIDYYKEVRDYEISLRDECFIGIFSNLYMIDKERLDKEVGINNYDYLFLSFEMGLKKPDIDGFKKVNDMVSFCEDDILFIDDSLENIEMAKKIGWHTAKCSGSNLFEIKRVCREFLDN